MERGGAKRKPDGADEDASSPGSDKRIRIKGSALVAIEGRHTLRTVADLRGLRAALEEEPAPPGCETVVLATRCMSVTQADVMRAADFTCRRLGNRIGPSDAPLDELQFKHRTVLVSPCKTSKHESPYEVAIVVQLHVPVDPERQGSAARLAAANAGMALARDILQPVAEAVAERLVLEALRDMLDEGTCQAARPPPTDDGPYHFHHIPYVIGGGEAPDVLDWTCQALSPSYGSKTAAAAAIHASCLQRYGGRVYHATVWSRPMDLANLYQGLYQCLQEEVGVVTGSVLDAARITLAAYLGVAMTDGSFRATTNGKIILYRHCCQLGDIGWAIMWPIVLRLFNSTRVYVEVNPWKPDPARLAHLQFQSTVKITAGHDDDFFGGVGEILPPSIQGRRGCAKSDTFDETNAANLRNYVCTPAEQASFLLGTIAGDGSIFARAARSRHGTAQPMWDIIASKNKSMAKLAEQLTTELLADLPKPPKVRFKDITRVRCGAEAHLYHVVLEGRWVVGALLDRFGQALPQDQLPPLMARLARARLQRFPGMGTVSGMPALAAVLPLRKLSVVCHDVATRVIITALDEPAVIEVPVEARLTEGAQPTAMTLVVLRHPSPSALAARKGWAPGTTVTHWVTEAQARVLTGAKHNNEDMTKHLLEEEYLTSGHVVGISELELWRGRGIDALKKVALLSKYGNSVEAIWLPLDTLRSLLLERPLKGQVLALKDIYGILLGGGKGEMATAALDRLQAEALRSADIFLAVTAAVEAAEPETRTLPFLLGRQAPAVVQMLHHLEQGAEDARVSLNEHLRCTTSVVDLTAKLGIMGPKATETGLIRLLSGATLIWEENKGVVAGKRRVVVHAQLDRHSAGGKLQYYRFHFTMLGDPRGKVAVVDGVLRGPCSKKMMDPTCSTAMTCSAVIETQGGSLTERGEGLFRLTTTQEGAAQLAAAGSSTGLVRYTRPDRKASRVLDAGRRVTHVGPAWLIDRQTGILVAECTVLHGVRVVVFLGNCPPYLRMVKVDRVLVDSPVMPRSLEGATVLLAVHSGALQLRKPGEALRERQAAVAALDDLDQEQEREDSEEEEQEEQDQADQEEQARASGEQRQHEQREQHQRQHQHQQQQQEEQQEFDPPHKHEQPGSQRHPEPSQQLSQLTEELAATSTSCGTFHTAFASLLATTQVVQQDTASTPQQALARFHGECPMPSGQAASVLGPSASAVQLMLQQQSPGLPPGSLSPLASMGGLQAPAGDTVVGSPTLVLRPGEQASVQRKGGLQPVPADLQARAARYMAQRAAAPAPQQAAYDPAAWSAAASAHASITMPDTEDADASAKLEGFAHLQLGGALPSGQTASVLGPSASAVQLLLQQQPPPGSLSPLASMGGLQAPAGGTVVGSPTLVFRPGDQASVQRKGGLQPVPADLQARAAGYMAHLAAAPAPQQPSPPPDPNQQQRQQRQQSGLAQPPAYSDGIVISDSEDSGSAGQRCREEAAKRVRECKEADLQARAAGYMAHLAAAPAPQQPSPPPDPKGGNP